MSADTQGTRATQATPDQWRTVFAAERTLLAWVRTGIALMGFGFLIERFGLMLGQFRVLRGEPELPREGVSVWFGSALVLMSVLVMVGAGVRYWRSLRWIAGGTVLARPLAQAAPLSLTFLLALLGLALSGYLLGLDS